MNSALIYPIIFVVIVCITLRQPYDKVKLTITWLGITTITTVIIAGVVFIISVVAHAEISINIDKVVELDTKITACEEIESKVSGNLCSRRLTQEKENLEQLKYELCSFESSVHAFNNIGCISIFAIDPPKRFCKESETVMSKELKKRYDQRYKQYNSVRQNRW